MRSAWLLILATTACGTVPSMPWLYGFDAVASSTGTEAPSAPADDDVVPGCGAGAARPIELVADVTPAAGRETIVASYAGGISVYDSENHLVMETPGYPCEGSYDELEAIAVGSIYGKPALAIAATSGGRRETATWIGLFSIGRTIDPTFTGVVETRDGETIDRGSIQLLPDALLYRRPGREVPRLWRFEPNARVYMPILPDVPHDEPPLVSIR